MISAPSTLALEADPGADPAPAGTDEPAILRAAIAGDLPAREEIVRRHHRRVYAYLHQMTRHREDAEDLTQQTFIKALRHLDRVDPDRPVIHWLLTIARNTALNHFRDGPRWSELPAEIASDTASPARRAEDRDHLDQLWAKARRLLTPREFEVLWLRFAEEMSIADLARTVRLNQIHVKVIIHRARHRLLKGECPP
ncbi:MAG: sigma-70 family RNA polymerase sigma factor [Opitutaceae bacterium]|nr:sigma-70 family RNA polymerase sigma factor [Opitutaceae bacterium]